MRCCVLRGIWTNHLKNKVNIYEIIVRLIQTRYYAELKHWDLEYIKQGDDIYDLVSRDIQLRK